MLTSSERRVLVALLCWLGAGLALDALLTHRPQTLVPLLGRERLLDLALTGAPDGEAEVGLAADTAAAHTRRNPTPRRLRAGRAMAYDALGRLDLNRADSTELVLLPGVGPALAARILAARGRAGRFARPEDLLEVRGIGPKTLAKLLPKVMVRAVQDSLAAPPAGR